MRKTAFPTLAAALCCVLAAACASDGPARRQARSEAAPALAGAASERLQPPLSLDLAGTDRGDGTVELVATLQVSGRLAAPPVLRIALPAGATLSRGLAAETLQAPGTAVTVERRWVVAGATGPVTVTAQSVGAASGVQVTASWPRAEPPSPVPAPEARPIPPTTVHGVRVDQAIPLDAGKKE